jgi:hypothetical protein
VLRLPRIRAAVESRADGEDLAAPGGRRRDRGIRPGLHAIGLRHRKGGVTPGKSAPADAGPKCTAPALDWIVLLTHWLVRAPTGDGQEAGFRSDQVSGFMEEGAVKPGQVQIVGAMDSCGPAGRQRLGHPPMISSRICRAGPNSFRAKIENLSAQARCNVPRTVSRPSIE